MVGAIIRDLTSAASLSAVATGVAGGLADTNKELVPDAYRSDPGWR